VSRGFGRTERAALRVLAPAIADGPWTSLRTVATRMYGDPTSGQIESVRRSLHRLERFDRVELQIGTVAGEGWQHRLVARAVPWTLFAPLPRRPDYPAAAPFDGAPDALVQSVTRFGARYAAEHPWSVERPAPVPAEPATADLVDRLLADWEA
jgi:hypothetical protein